MCFREFHMEYVEGSEKLGDWMSSMERIAMREASGNT